MHQHSRLIWGIISIKFAEEEQPAQFEKCYLAIWDA